MNRSFSLNREHACDVRSLTIQQKTHIGFALVTTLLALLCGTIIWGSFRQYRQENADLQSFEFVRGAIVAANVISAERGPTNDLLVRLQNDGAAERRNLLAARARSDQALARFSAGIVQATTLDERERDNLLHALDTIRITLADARSEVDALDARPLASRTVHDIQHAQARLFRIVDAVSLLIDGAMTDTAMRDPHTSGAILLARLLGDLREYAGRTGSLLIAPMFARQALDRAQFADIMRMRGRIEQLRALIDGAIGAQFDDPDVVREYAQLDAAFDGHLLPLVDATVAAGQTGAYATSAADFSRTIVPYFRPSELLRDRIIDLARRRAIADRDAARIKVVVSALATALCIAILFSLARATQRLLSKPLDALGRRIIALSDGDTAHVSIPRGVAPEIARIHEALETLRNAYVRRDMLERQRNDMLTLFSHDMRAPLTSLIILIATQEQRAGETQMKRQFARIGKLARGSQRIRARAGQPRRPDERSARRGVAARAPEAHVDRRRAAARRRDRAGRSGPAVARADQPARQRDQVQRVADERRMQGRAGRRRQDRALHDPRQRMRDRQRGPGATVRTLPALSHHRPAGNQRRRARHGVRQGGRGTARRQHPGA